MLKNIYICRNYLLKLPHDIGNIQFLTVLDVSKERRKPLRWKDIDLKILQTLLWFIHPWLVSFRIGCQTCPPHSPSSETSKLWISVRTFSPVWVRVSLKLRVWNFWSRLETGILVIFLVCSFIKERATTSGSRKFLTPSTIFATSEAFTSAPTRSPVCPAPCLAVSVSRSVILTITSWWPSLTASPHCLSSTSCHWQTTAWVISHIMTKLWPLMMLWHLTVTLPCLPWVSCARLMLDNNPRLHHLAYLTGNVIIIVTKMMMLMIIMSSPHRLPPVHYLLLEPSQLGRNGRAACPQHPGWGLEHQALRLRGGHRGH